ncbi:MAG: hypothetical protein ACOYT7_02970 [Patescibacteria group bacterium]
MGNRGLAEHRRELFERIESMTPAKGISAGDEEKVWESVRNTTIPFLLNERLGIITPDEAERLHQKLLACYPQFEARLKKLREEGPLPR